MTLSCAVTFWIFLNCSFLLVLSIVGFMIFLEEVKNQTIFREAYYGLSSLPLASAFYTICYFKRIWHWYYLKILRPSVANELLQN